MERGEYKLKTVFMADHEIHYSIYKGDDLIGDFYIHPRFRDARIETIFGDFYINEQNCKEVLEKIQDADLRELIRSKLSKLNICV